MTEKFTSGEWAVIDGTQIGEQILFVHIQGKGVICRLTKVKDTHIPLSEEDIANAHLIAAAPDMYRALEALKDNCAFPKTIEIEIQKVLAKARGEA